LPQLSPIENAKPLNSREKQKAGRDDCMWFPCTEEQAHFIKARGLDISQQECIHDTVYVFHCFPAYVFDRAKFSPFIKGASNESVRPLYQQCRKLGLAHIT
jgi:hypothetical protein